MALVGPLVTSHPPLTFHARLLPRRLADTLGPVQRGRAPSARLPLRERRCAALVSTTAWRRHPPSRSRLSACPCRFTTGRWHMSKDSVNRELRSLMKRHCVRRSAQRASQAASYFSIVLKETLKPSSECGQASRHGAS
jgi:hypothetical protein